MAVTHPTQTIKVVNKIPAAINDFIRFLLESPEGWQSPPGLRVYDPAMVAAAVSLR